MEPPVLVRVLVLPGSKPPTYDDNVRANVAKVTTCKPFPRIVVGQSRTASRAAARG